MKQDYSNNVVIHIRVGDIRHPASPDFLQNVKSSLDILLQDEHVHYYFIAEDPKAGDHQPPKGFEYIFETLQRHPFMNSLDVRSSLYDIMNVDMLIMTGSGFPYIAAVTSSKPVVLRGTGPNKEGEHELYQHRDWIRLDENGVIYEPRSLSEVYRKITVKKHLFHGKTVPY